MIWLYLLSRILLNVSIHGIYNEDNLLMATFKLGTFSNNVSILMYTGITSRENTSRTNICGKGENLSERSK